MTQFGPSGHLSHLSSRSALDYALGIASLFLIAIRTVALLSRWAKGANYGALC